MNEQLRSIEELVGSSEGGLVNPLQYEQKTFPQFDPNGPSIQHGGPIVTEVVVPGMTYRQWLIGLAMQGDFAYPGADDLSIAELSKLTDEELDVRCAVYERYADRIIARMEERRSKKNESA